MSSITGALKDAGFEPKPSTVGDKLIYVGGYKSMFVGYENQPDAKFGAQIVAKFQITERLWGTDYFGTFPQFTGYFPTTGKEAADKKKGVAKLIEGFLSVGKVIDQSSDEAFHNSLGGLVGSAEVYIKASSHQPMKEEPAGSGNWIENTDKEPKQAFSFMTEKNALKLAAKEVAKAGHPL